VPTLLVAGGDGPKILEAIDAAFHDLAALVSLCVKFRWSSSTLPPSQVCFAGSLSFWTDAPELACPAGTPVLARSRRTVHPKGRGTLAGASWTGTLHPNRVQEGQEGGRVTRLSCRNQDAQGAPVPVAQQVDFGGSSPPADPEPLVFECPLCSSLAGSIRAPTALRWALTWGLSTAAPSQSIFPSASAVSCSAARIAAQVPSRDQRVKRSWQVGHDPYRSGMSRRGAPVF
jgi:hypothetical protein